MTIALIMAAALAALAGMAAGRLAGPLTLGWPRRGQELLERVAALSQRQPRLRARAAGAMTMGLVLVGGPLAAYSAAPSAPAATEARPGRLAGLADSEDQRQPIAAPPITEARLYAGYPSFKDLTPAARPTASAAARRRPLTLIDMTSESYDALMAVRNAYFQEVRNAAVQDGHVESGGRISDPEFRAVLGDRYQAYLDNDRQLSPLIAARQRYDALASGDINTVLAIDHLPVDGPQRFEVPFGMTIEDGAHAAGLASSRGYGLERRPAGDPTLMMVKCNTPEGDPSLARCA